MHILVADDDSITRMTLRTVLISDGHTVTVASDGEDALAKLAVVVVDMIISDVYMPTMNGLRLRNIVRKIPDIAHLPILFISGYDDKMTGEAILNPALEGFFRKGKPLTELLSWIRYLTSPPEKRSIYSPDIDAQPKPLSLKFTPPVINPGIPAV